MRAVIDTNVLISGLLWRGSPHAVLERVRAGTLTLVSSPALIAEFTDTIARPKFKKVLARSGIKPERIVTDLRRVAELIDPPPLGSPVSRDPDDDAVLALAAASRADLIISGDADLLALGSHAGIPIVDPAGAIAKLVR